MWVSFVLFILHSFSFSARASLYFCAISSVWDSALRGRRRRRLFKIFYLLRVSRCQVSESAGIFPLHQIMLKMCQALAGAHFAVNTVRISSWLQLNADSMKSVFTGTHLDFLIFSWSSSTPPLYLCYWTSFRMPHTCSKLYALLLTLTTGWKEIYLLICRYDNHILNHTCIIRLFGFAFFSAHAHSTHTQFVAFSYFRKCLLSIFLVFMRMWELI